MRAKEEIRNPFRRMLDERFGMFVHYGLYSGFEGFYQGQEIKGCAEWIQRFAPVPLAEYEKTGRETFCPVPDFAKKLAKTAKDAGMRYIVITSKHHDGFCLYKTSVSEYNSWDFFGRDLIREVADACREEGLRLGLYYSHTLDWHEKDAGGNFLAASKRESRNRNWLDFPDDNIDFEKYFREKCLPQVREILTNYGDINLVWFDYPHDITKEQSIELHNLVKELQPDCQINSRISFGICDYQSLADNALPEAPTGVNMECLITLNDTWGYHRGDHNWKTTEEAVGILCRTLTADSTLLMNVGPKPDGMLTDETYEILRGVGEWTKRNSDAVYGNISGNPFSTMFPWGYVSRKENKIFLYIKDKTEKEFLLPGVEGRVKSVYVLGSDEEIKYRLENNSLLVEAAECDLIVPVYVIEFETNQIFAKEIMQCGDCVNLGVLWAGKMCDGDEILRLSVEGDEYCEGYGQKGAQIDGSTYETLDFWTDANETIFWDAVFLKSGVYDAELIHKPAKEYGEFSLTLADTTNKVDMENEKSRFRRSKTGTANIRISRDAGRFVINESGKYRVAVNRTNNGENLPISEIRFKLSK